MSKITWAEYKVADRAEAVLLCFIDATINSFSAGMLNTIMLVVREAEYYACYTLAAGGGEFRPSPNTS